MRRASSAFPSGATQRLEVVSFWVAMIILESAERLKLRYEFGSFVMRRASPAGYGRSQTCSAFDPTTDAVKTRPLRSASHIGSATHVQLRVVSVFSGPPARGTSTRVDRS